MERPPRGNPVFASAPAAMIRTFRPWWLCLSHCAFGLAIATAALVCTATFTLAREPANGKRTPAESLAGQNAAFRETSTTTNVELGRTSSRPATCRVCVRPADQVWIISTRQLGCATVIDASPDFGVQRRLADGSWATSSIAEFIAADDAALPTCFVIHGNQTDAGLAKAQGMRAYRALTASLPAEQPLRFVIWSWPSDRIHGILKDVRIKAARTTAEGIYLGWTLHQLNPQTPVSLVGFSFGARIATGGLHVLAGGSLNGYSLPPTLPLPPGEGRGEGNGNAAFPSRVPFRAILVAPALHNYWLADGQYHGRALEIVDDLLLVKNSCDSALKRYRFVDTSRRADALGYTGPAGWSPHYSKLRQVDACCDLGKAHDWELYLASSRYTALMRQHAWPRAVPANVTAE
jgi:hypothetical protein